MDVGKLSKSIFRGPKQRRAQRFVAELASHLSKLYDEAVKDALLEQRANLLDIHGTGRDLAVDLSPEGAGELMDNLPSSIASFLNTEGIEVIKRSLKLLMIFENYKTIENLWLHPLVREMMIKLLESKIAKG
jgi:hypothetical protein